jgi:methyl acetate hydrolase
MNDLLTELRRVRIESVLRDAVEDDVVPGVVAIVAAKDGTSVECAAGVANIETGSPMGANTVLRLASMTKLLTVIVAWKEIERAGFSIDDAVGEIMPEFDDLLVLTGFDGDAPLLRPPARRATVRNLLTHTAGLGYDLWNEQLLRYEQVTGTPGTAEGSLRTFTAPLVADPGARFDYGSSADWLGRIAERLSGKPLDALYREHITGPLRMTDTVPFLSSEQRGRSAPAHVREGAGWAISDADYAQTPEFIAGGHALYSTPRDFMILQRALLDGGKDANGSQAIPHDLVEAMSRSLLTDVSLRSLTSAMRDTVADLVLDEADGWGPGLLISSGREGGRSAGSFGWMGLYNTSFWVDPAAGVTAAIYCQALPFLDPRIHGLLSSFEESVYA